MKTSARKSRLAATSLCALLFLAGSARAGTFSYEISVDTSAFSGAGYLDFQFNPGVTPYDAATAGLTGFQTDGTLATPAAPFGDVTGSFPGTVTLGNTNSLNEYTPGFVFGSFFNIFVTLNIPSVSGTAAGGSTFALDVQDSGFNSLLGNFPAVQIDLDATTGQPAVTNNSSGAATLTETPEPASLLLAAAGFACFWKRSRKS